MAYTGYGRRGDIGILGQFGGWGGPQIGDSIFDFGPTNFSSSSAPASSSSSTSTDGCPEGQTRNAAGVCVSDGGGCIYGRNADGSCKEPNVPKCSDKGAGWYGNWGTAGEGCWQVPTGVNVTETGQGDVFTHGTKYGMTDARDIYGRTGADAFEKGAYLPNYSALYSGGASTGGQGPNLGVWTEGPYALEGPEKSLLGYNQLGQPTDPEFVRRMNEINDGTWSAEDEDRFVLERTLGGIDKSILEEGKAITDAYGDNPYKGLLAKEGEDFLKGAAGSGTKGYYTKMSKDYEDWYKEYQEAQEQLNFMRSQAVKDRLMSGGILDVKKEYEQAEHELDRMADAGILSTKEETTIRRNLHQEEEKAIKEVVNESKPKSGGNGRDKGNGADKKKTTSKTARTRTVSTAPRVVPKVIPATPPPRRVKFTPPPPPPPPVRTSYGRRSMGRPKPKPKPVRISSQQRAASERSGW